MQGISKYQLIDESSLNGRAFVTQSAGIKRTSHEAEFEESSEADSDGGESPKAHRVHLNVPIPDGPKPGKKTKGRVKIKMEFIDNKLRRYTTFSKRKTGIMKKAYELSTLTGTQVMLLVASETGHVYTFATRKLQPMITSDSGKALIQTCLNSPDPPPTTPSQQKAVNQRMNPTGFEETELSYAVNEEEGGRPDSPDMGMPKNYSIQAPQQPTPPSVHTHSNTPSPLRQTPVMIEPQPAYQQSVMSGNQQFTFVTRSSNTQSTSQTSPSVAKANPNISMQLTGGGGITAILPSGLTAGTPLTLSALGNQQGGASGQQQTFYRIPTQQGQAVVALPNMSQQASSSKSDTVGTITLSSSQPNVTVVPATGGSASTPPGTVMYQTPQGVVYAAPSSALPEGFIFNLPQTPTLQVASPDSSGGQQFITIPVSLAGAQVLQPIYTSALDASGGQKKANK